MIYLATNYSDPDPAIQQRRYERVTKYAAHLVRGGHMVISPITHSHPIAIQGTAHDFPFWKKWNLQLLSICDRFIAFHQNGWECSAGLEYEKEIAQTMKMIIETVDGERVEWL